MDSYALLAAAVVALIISTPVCGFFILFYWFPHYLIKLSFLVRQFRAGMKIKYVGDENFVFCYGERGSPKPDKTSIVFIHGFTSSKDQWISCFKGLPKDLHLIAVDMPGHGASSVPGEDVKLDLIYIVDILVRFFDLVGLADRKVHLIGSSLGGSIAGLFTARHPQRIKKLTMVCPAMQTPEDSEITLQVKEALAVGMENVSPKSFKLLPTDIPGCKAMFEVCCYSKDLIKFSDQIWKGFLHLRLPKTDFYFKLFKAFTAEENLDLLERVALKITVPTQLIWGQHDQVIHVSGAEVLRSKLANCQRVDIIDKCGHAVDIDRPGAFLKYLRLFMESDSDSMTHDKKSL